MIKPILRLTPFVLLVLFLGYRFLLQEPPVWPDEAIFADIARNIITHGQQGTSLWSGMIPGVERFAFWYPPFLFNILAIWFRVFGFSIENQRMLSIIIAGLFVATFYLFAFVFAKNNMSKTRFVSVAAGLAMALLSIDRNFLDAVRINRPEILLLLFFSFVLFVFNKYLIEAKHASRRVWLFISGGILGLGLTTHFIFVPYLLIVLFLFGRYKIIKDLIRPEFLIGLVLFVFLWMVSILDSVPILLSQVYQVIAVRGNNPNWLEFVLSGKDLQLKLMYLAYFYLTADFIIWSVRNKAKGYLGLWMVIVLSFLVAAVGKIRWYYVLPIPFIYLAGSIRIVETMSSSRRNLGKFLAALSIVCMGLLMWTNIDRLLFDFTVLSDGRYSYKVYSEKILAQVPENKTVFLSALPDPYFAFPAGRNKIFEFPVLPLTTEAYRTVLNNSDFILFNVPLDYTVAGDYLQQYIQRNAEKIVHVANPNQYSIYIIELKPRSERT